MTKLTAWRNRIDRLYIAGTAGRASPLTAYLSTSISAKADAIQFHHLWVDNRLLSDDPVTPQRENSADIAGKCYVLYRRWVAPEQIL